MARDKALQAGASGRLAMTGEDARELLASNSDSDSDLEGSHSPKADHGEVKPAVGRPRLPNIPQRQSSFAQQRPPGTPRTPNRVRFEIDDNPFGDSSRIVDGDLLDEEDYLGDSPASDRRDSSGQRRPLLTDIEAPSVTVASEGDEFNPEEWLESARPKSGMKSAFMNMANSIM